MIDHLGLRVTDLERSRVFFEQALAPLGFKVLMTHDISGIGFGRGFKPQFWIKVGRPAPGLHVAIGAEDRASIDAFHAAALAAGGTDDGAPGLRPEYHPTYYGAFVLDPDGHSIEAVSHAPEP